ncbi:E3 ubiquitin-protein ligase RNF26 [Frankliniella fusca]|uniref:E3 ubiquitin-protein ligase RNF26 n=1 Tax=Frankliniella fusca TaxID=407009 RepID=A0AAE1HH32_9NEOP|nr:E3 ubiquitin-protein ligase RNF26 [Frankliniella fusca]
MTPSLHGPRHFTADRAPNVDQLRETPSREENLNVSADQFERKVPQEPEDRLCVVCQDSEKCTIILPCRHVCLCYECCSTIKRTHGKCPICRHVVRRTMRVYI